MFVRCKVTDTSIPVTEGCKELQQYRSFKMSETSWKGLIPNYLFVFLCISDRRCKKEHSNDVPIIFVLKVRSRWRVKKIDLTKTCAFIWFIV